MIFRALARHMRKNNIVLGILCIILVFGIVKELQFLTVIALFVGLLIIYPKIKIDIPNIVREVIKEISIGKS